MNEPVRNRVQPRSKSRVAMEYAAESSRNPVAIGRRPKDDAYLNHAGTTARGALLKAMRRPSSHASLTLRLLIGAKLWGRVSARRGIRRVEPR